MTWTWDVVVNVSAGRGAAGRALLGKQRPESVNIKSTHAQPDVNCLARMGLALASSALPPAPPAYLSAVCITVDGLHPRPVHLHLAVRSPSCPSLLLHTSDLDCGAAHPTSPILFHHLLPPPLARNHPDRRMPLPINHQLAHQEPLPHALHRPSWPSARRCPRAFPAGARPSTRGAAR